MVGHAGSTTGIVHADVTLTRSKVKVTGHLNFRKLSKPCMLVAMTAAPLRGFLVRGKDMAGHARWHCAVSCAKTAPIKMPFGLWTPVGRRKHVLHGDTLAQPGKYVWTVHVPRRYSLVSNYLSICYALVPTFRVTRQNFAKILCYKPGVIVQKKLDNVLSRFSVHVWVWWTDECVGGIMMVHSSGQ